MKEERVIENIILGNGETLQIIDKSRMIAKDTWLVSLIFRIEIELNKKIIDKIITITEDSIRDSLESPVIYEVMHERNFINENNKDKVLKDMRDSFLNTNLKYLSHADFSHKYVIKKYNDKKKKF